MSCLCCGTPLARGTDIPDARWLRHGDLYCKICRLVNWREHLADGWPADRLPCRRHARSEGDT